MNYAARLWPVTKWNERPIAPLREGGARLKPQPNNLENDTDMSLKQTLKSLTLGAVLLSLCSCASIITSGDRKVQVTSHPTAATVTVYDIRSNVVTTATTPTTVKLKKGAGYFKGADYRLVVEKAGYQPREYEIRHDINGWYWGNFALGGMLGFLVVDPLTGGMWELKPDQIDAELVPVQPAVTLGEQRLVILARQQLTPEQQQRLVPLAAPLPAGREPAAPSR